MREIRLSGSGEGAVLSRPYLINKESRLQRCFCVHGPSGGSQSYEAARLALANPLKRVASMLASIAAKSSAMAALPGSC